MCVTSVMEHWKQLTEAEDNAISMRWDKLTWFSLLSIGIKILLLQCNTITEMHPHIFRAIKMYLKTEKYCSAVVRLFNKREIHSEMNSEWFFCLCVYFTSSSRVVLEHFTIPNESVVKAFPWQLCLRFFLFDEMNERHIAGWFFNYTNWRIDPFCS